MQYGYKRDYPPIEIFANGKYIGTTTWSKTCKEAATQFLGQNPDAKNVKCSFKVGRKPTPSRKQITPFIRPEQIMLGTRFELGKEKRVCTVVDILKTYNLAGDLVETSYLCKHSFLGQSVWHRECATTIQTHYMGQKND